MSEKYLAVPFMNSFHVIAVETVANCLSEIGSLFGYTLIFDIIRNIIALQCLLPGSIASCVMVVALLDWTGSTGYLDSCAVSGNGSSTVRTFSISVSNE